MLKIDLPPATDKNSLKRLWKDPNWQSHRTNWEDAYKNYIAGGGDTWKILPQAFAVDVSVEQRKLYDSRKSSGPIRRIRSTTVACCPMCGSETTNTIDHFLPRNSYPEFSIFTRNLVPCCGLCNSGAKKTIIKGTSPERFLHPYFDQLLSTAIWRVEFVAPLAAVRFHPVPEPGLAPDDIARVRFHLENVFAEPFYRTLATTWANLPQSIRDRLANLGTITSADVQQELGFRLQQEVTAMRPNSWSAGFIRGLAYDPAALGFVAASVNNLKPTPPITF